MDQLPSSIEAYLEEAGFSGTEILILRRFMDGEPLTIRQLGAKTGKSTGVLDQAMKKLMKKNIIKRTLINETPKYSLDSLESVVEWMQDDMEQKRDMLLRRHQNFESFVTSLESGSKRPDIEYFEGEGGIKQAYIKLLNGPGEIFHYLPVTGKEEEDPLRDFRVQYFRERQNRKMFSRILAHDNVLGRRYQSRDAFEYRKTVLVPETEYPFTFEKIITGDRIACFDHKAKTACVIRYPELADIEKTLFEAIWRQVQVKVKQVEFGVPLATLTPESEKIALSTEAISQLREFFLSPKSFITLCACAILAGSITFGLYKQNVALNLARLQERAASIAGTAALQFDLADLEKIQTDSDVSKPEYPKIIHHLNRIRRENPGVTYIYLLRPTQNPLEVAFIADADSLDPYAEVDINNDGVINEMDELNVPGERYDISQDPALKQAMETGLLAVNESTYTDKWGTFISATGLIKDDKGNVRAALGVDIAADQLYALTRSQFQSILYFILFFLLFIAVRFATVKPKALQSLIKHISIRRVGIFFSIVFVLTSLIFFLIIQRERHIADSQTGERLKAIAATAASQFHIDELDKLKFAKDMRTNEYQNAFETLNTIRRKNSGIKWVYILRKVEGENMWEFVADADANYFLNGADDYNVDSFLSPDEENVWPGRRYYYEWDVFQKALVTPSYTSEPEIDQWGEFITGAASIRKNDEPSAYVLGIDFEI